MKKVLALVLAVMMMATVAFADATAIAGSGSDLNGGSVTLTKPGEKLKVGEGDIQGTNNTKAVNSTNYTISNIKYTEGKALVESIKFDDNDDRLVVKLKQDYTMTTPKTLDMTLVLKGKKVNKTKPADVEVTVKATVGYVLRDGKSVNDLDSGIIIDANGDVKAPKEFEKAVYKVVKAADAEDAYGTMEFTTADDEVEVEVRVYDGDKFYLASNQDADKDILKANDGADITFLNFPANPTFSATAKVYFYKEEGTYIYAVKDGKLTAITANAAGAAGQTAGAVKWDDDEGCYVLNARTLGSYAFSDTKLKVSAATADSQNPDTGANDVVGIATALAAVALVSAAAVSLKK